eukprot:COSAG06_NODE_44703_length_361_cov_0.793893_2_plen_23_part_01
MLLRCGVLLNSSSMSSGVCENKK